MDPKLLIKSGNSTSTKIKGRVPVRFRPSDNMGAAPLPEGYLQYKNTTTAPIIVPKTYQENKRIQQEQTPYVAPSKDKKKILRAAGGEIWEDESLARFDENDYRLFVGDLGNEVTDDLLARSFSKYTSLLRTYVVRDKKTSKSKGYGFISFRDPDDFVKAMREMNGFDD